MKTVNGTYGNQKTKCEVHVYEVNGINWYAVDGSLNVNATFNDIQNGVNVEELEDLDCFTANLPIASPEEIKDNLDE